MHTPWPSQVLLEVTNACDLACRHCHFHGDGVQKTRPVGRMATVNMVAYDDASTPADQFVERWRGIADAVTISRFRPVGSRRFSPIELARVPCYQLDSILAVAWDGHVAMCCEDPQVSEPVGRFPEASLAQIWNGARMQELRAAHRAGDYSASKLCADCDAWTGIYGRDGKAPGVLVTERTAATIYEYVDPTGAGAGGA